MKLWHQSGHDRQADRWAADAVFSASLHVRPNLQCVGTWAEV